MNTTRENGEDGLRQSMISRRNGVRDVRHRPGSPAETRESTRYWSLHWLMVRSGSGRSALANASPNPGEDHLRAGRMLRCRRWHWPAPPIRARSPSSESRGPSWRRSRPPGRVARRSGKPEDAVAERAARASAIRFRTASASISRPCLVSNSSRRSFARKTISMVRACPKLAPPAWGRGSAAGLSGTCGQNRCRGRRRLIDVVYRLVVEDQCRWRGRRSCRRA